MSLWSRAKKAAHKAAKQVARASSAVVNTVTEVAADVVETAGNGLERGINAVADAARTIPGVGGAISTGLRWVARTGAAATDLGAAAIKSGGELVGSTMAGATLIVIGTVTFDGSLIKDGAVDVGTGTAGATVLVGGKVIATLSALFPGTEQRQRLTRREEELLRRVFKESVALENVRLVRSKGGSGLLMAGDRPFTLGNVIYLKDRDTNDEPELLVHECTHIWQFQNIGADYAGRAIAAQWFVPQEYSWERELSRGKRRWIHFNAEAQAQLLEDIYRHGQLVVSRVVPTASHTAVPKHHIGRRPSPMIRGLAGSEAAVPILSAPGVFYDADPPSSTGRFEFNSRDPDHPIDYTELANDAVAVVRHAVNYRPSGELDEWSVETTEPR